jgi:integral membrane protein
MIDLLKSPLGRLRIVGFLEGCSFLLLGLTMVLKYQFLMPFPNYVVGLAHGVLFITYVLLVLQVSYINKWSLVTMFWAFLASLIPFGTFYADYKIFNRTMPDTKN